MFLWVPGDGECRSLCRSLADLLPTLNITLMQYNADKLCYVPKAYIASAPPVAKYNTPMRL